MRKGLGEPESAVRTWHDNGGLAIGRRHREPGNHSRGRDPVNGVCKYPRQHENIVLGKPQVAIGTSRDALTKSPIYRERRADTGRRDSRNARANKAGGPQITVRTCCDTSRDSVDWELRNGSRGRDPADPFELREPKGAIRARCNGVGKAVRRGERKLRDGLSPGDAG